VIDPGRGRGRYSVGKYNRETIEQLPVDRLLAKVAGGDGIYFTPGASIFPAVFVDDLDIIPPEATLVIETSRGNYQAHFKLTDPVEQPSHAKEIQTGLIAAFDGDQGANSVLHPRRLPGFANMKYPDAPTVRIVRYDPERLTITPPASVPAPPPPRERGAPLTRTKERLKSWQDFSDQDKSRADMRYVHYLVAGGLTDDEIGGILIHESPGLLERKADPDDYIARTIKAARTYRR